MNQDYMWRRRRILEFTAENLSAREFEAVVVSNAAEAYSAVLDRIPGEATVGIGGSVTIREIGIVTALEREGRKVYQHWLPKATEEEVLAIRKAQLTSDVFLSSVNAVTVGGVLVSSDGVGNRVAAMIFGPPKVIVVAGANKLVRTVEDGLDRIRNVAAPINARRLELEYPCAEAGYCKECEDACPFCRATTIISRRPLKTAFTVVLVNEELGY